MTLDREVNPDVSLDADDLSTCVANPRSTKYKSLPQVIRSEGTFRRHVLLPISLIG